MTPLTIKEARESGFKVLAGPYSFEEIDAAGKVMKEAIRNSRVPTLVRRLGKHKKICYEVWQKSGMRVAAKA